MSRRPLASDRRHGGPPAAPLLVERQPGTERRAFTLKRVAAIIGLAGVRTVNAWLYHTPLDVFIERTVLMVLLAYAITGWRARAKRRHCGRLAAPASAVRSSAPPDGEIEVTGTGP